MIELIAVEWLETATRWLHLIAGIAWIGSSFYFMALDASLRPRDGQPEGVLGETWQVHGGGFYHMRKYMVAPPELPDRLTWFKWEAYVTFLSGFFLLGVMYYLGAELYMIDQTVAEIGQATAIMISIAALLGSLFLYEIACRSPLGEDQRILAAMGLIAFPLIVLILGQFLSARAAFIHGGAVIGTIMVANVAHIIIPGQRKVVAALRAGEVPDPKYGKQAKQRSVHNNYLTLPVLFAMIGGHYPLAFASAYNWLIFALVLIAGASIRHFFNEHHAGRHAWWGWGVAAVCGLLAVWISTFPKSDDLASVDPSFDVASLDQYEVEGILLSRCSMCHAAEPYWDGVVVAPKNVVLESLEDFAKHSRGIYLQASHTHAMPPGNVTLMEEREREYLAAWYRAYIDGEVTFEP